MESGSLLLSACVALFAQEPPAAAPAAQQAPIGVEAELEKLEAAQTAEQVAASLDVLLAQHEDSKELARAAQLLARRHTSLAVEKFLRAVATGSESKEARGFATFALAQLLLRYDSTLEFLANPKLDEKQRETFVARRGAELVADLQKRDRAALEKEVEELLQTVVDDYFLLEHAPTGYLGGAADPQLYELQHLQVGMVAPEIEGKDEDGVPFALSDYRGKVVALDFWGFWCPICVRNLPSERETVAKHKDAPFSMLGVNSDPMSRLIEAEKHDPIPWRNFFDGGDAYGPIARKWNVRSWPVIYVLDENGVIRLKTEDAHAMAAKVDELLAAMQAKEAAAIKRARP